jgi:flagellar biosynthetic protein FliR
MEFAPLIANAQLYLLILARIYALFQVAPLLSSSAIPRIARTALALFTAAAVFPMVQGFGYPIPEAGLSYALLMLGEVMVGLLIGFFLTMIYSALLISGQFYAFQMGFGASVVYDPLAQVELPLMGQFLNLLAMYVFIVSGGFIDLFLKGVYRSFQAFRAIDLVLQQEYIAQMLISGMTKLFGQALIIAFPVMGTLILVSVSMGLLAKAAPQMNLLMLGFPIRIGVAFIVILVTLPVITTAFIRILDAGYFEIMRLLRTGTGGAV